MKTLRHITGIAILVWACGFAAAQDAGAIVSAAMETSAVQPRTVTAVSVAIIDFESKTGNDVLGGQISDILTARLSVYDQFQLVERRKLDDLIKEYQLNLTGMVETADAVKVGKLAGARIMIFGSAFPVGREIYIVAKIVSIETSRVKGVMAKGKLDGELSETIDLLVERLAEGLEKWAPQLLPEDERFVNRVAQLKEKLQGRALPTLAVVIAESHVNRRIPDPAAETEMIKVLQEAGFTVKDTMNKSLPQWAKDFIKNPDGSVPSDFDQVDMVVAGEGISEFGARIGGLVSCPARLEVRVVSRRDNSAILLADRTTRRAVDISEVIASKTALQAAGHEMAIKVIERIAQHICNDEGSGEKGFSENDAPKQ